MIVLDASAAVALLVDGGPLGAEVGRVLKEHEVAYPSLLPYEVASALRRLSSNNVIGQRLAESSLDAVAELGSESFEFAELAARVWELRHNISTYDACYIALAELLEVPLLTLDKRLRRSPGVRCDFIEIDSTAVE